MRLIINSLLPICLLLCSVGIYAQINTDDFEHFTRNSGLPTHTVYSVTQAKNGFLWVATDAGVSRFDGKVFVNYTTEDGLGDNEVIDVYEDYKGRVWFTPFGEKVSYYYKNKIYNESTDSALKLLPPGFLFYCPIQDKTGNLYAHSGTNKPLVVQISTNNNITVIDLSELILPSDKIEVLSRSADGKQVYAFTTKGEMLLVSQQPKRLTSSWVYNSPPLKYSKPGTNNFMLVHNENGIYKLEDTSATLLLPAHKLPSQQVEYFVVMDKHQNIWISHLSHNTYFYRYKSGSYYDGVPLLTDVYATHAFDNEDNIWFITQKSGLYKLPFSKLLNSETYELNSTLLSKNITSVYVDKNNTLWVGYSNGFVTQISENHFTHHNLNYSTRSYNRVLQMVCDNQGNLWVATDETAILLKKLGEAHYGSKQRIKNPEKVSFIGSPKGVYIDTTSSIYFLEGTRLLKVQTDKINSSQSQTDKGRHYSSFFDAQNNCYISTVSGLLVVKNGKTTNLSATSPMLNVRAQHFTQNNDGTIFIATYSKGVLALKNMKLVASFTKADGLPGITCKRIYLRNDTVFIATNDGLCVASFINQSFKLIKNIHLSDGLPSADINDIAFEGNKLYIATAEGVSVINLPLRNHIPALPPLVSILSFKVNETAFEADEHITFPFNNQRIRIEYVAPTINKPQMVSYRYRFANTQSNWSVTNGNHLEFGDLSSGEYVLEIQSKKYNSLWGPSKLVKFTITPPFYSTLTFKISVALILTIVLFLGLRLLLTRRLRKQLQELKQKQSLEKERNRIAADIHDDIGAELTHIVLLSRMLKSDNELTLPTQSIVTKLENAADEVINSMNEVIWALNPSNDTVHKLVAHIRQFTSKLLAKHHLQANIQIADNAYINHPITSEVGRNVFLIVKESLHNVIKHSGASQVALQIQIITLNTLFIKITDNGTGFNPDETQSGNGLKNISKRAATIKAVVKITSTKTKGTETTLTITV